MVNIVEHKYSNKPPRYYIDGVRTNKERVNDIKDTHTLSCMVTRCKYDDKGNCHHINYTTATQKERY